jgi:PIN domain nuclease of toxin-antitoxin system
VIVLLDTHALIWSLEDSPQLSPTARSVIEDASNVVLASVVSAWEIAIKKTLGKLSAPDDIEAAIDAAAFTKRTITFADAQRLGKLPPHHRDPFDRMLISQALVDGTSIVTRDPNFARYSVPIVW